MKQATVKKIIELDREYRYLEERVDALEQLMGQKGVKIFAIVRNETGETKIELKHLDVTHSIEVEVQHNDFLIHQLARQIEEL